MYLSHWQMKNLPFENAPNPAFFYASLPHEEALTRLLFAIRHGKGSAMIVGSIGCGKTLLGEALPFHLPPQQYRVAHMRNPALQPIELLQTISSLFEVPCEEDAGKARILRALEHYLRKGQQSGRHSVLVVDEAQTIQDPDTLDELRMLLNLQSQARFLLSLILLGQNELEALVDQCPPLRQRLAVRFRLDALSMADTMKYVHHRVMLSGARIMPFTPDATDKIYELSSGIPRAINNLCDRALLAAYIKRQLHVDAATVEEAWQDLR